MRPVVAIACGGYSGEFEISMLGYETIHKHIDHKKFEAVRWLLTAEEWTITDEHGSVFALDKNDLSFERNGERVNISKVFNIIHGSPGEDGKLAGYLDMLGIPYQSPGVLASSISFNKAVCNAYLAKLGVKVADSAIYNRVPTIAECRVLADRIGLPCFVKPVDSGSSLGVSKVSEMQQLIPAFQKALQAGSAAMAEAFVQGTEVTCGVILYGGEVVPLAVTEVVFAGDFFDYDAKYTSAATQEITPARIDEVKYKECMDISVNIFKLLLCKGIFRADYILSNGIFYLIEVNTVPGMSARSFIPQQLEYKGISIGAVIDDMMG
jgi:D-alanine-D-alanine ligase